MNAYLLQQGNSAILIDTGFPSLWDRLDTALTAAGCDKGGLRLIVLTHADWDHAGNAAKVREKYGAKIALHPADARSIATGIRPKRSARLLSFRILHTIERFKRSFRKNGAAQIPVFTPDLFLSDGEDLAPFGLDARVVHLPGHTQGSIGIVTGEGDLFSGDTLVNRKGPVEALIIENKAELKESIARLKGMKLRMVYPGHGKPFPMARFLDLTKKGEGG